jgi:hypothetical protein
METVLSLAVVVGPLVVLAGLAVRGWSAGHGPAVPARVPGGGSSSAAPSVAAVIVVGLQRAEGVAGLGRHDERRCGF